MCREIPIVLSALIMGCTSVRKLEATGCEVILHSEEVNPVDGGEPEDEEDIHEKRGTTANYSEELKYLLQDERRIKSDGHSYWVIVGQLMTERKGFRFPGWWGALGDGAISAARGVRRANMVYYSA